MIWTNFSKDIQDFSCECNYLYCCHNFEIKLDENNLASSYPSNVWWPHEGCYASMC